MSNQISNHALQNTTSVETKLNQKQGTHPAVRLLICGAVVLGLW